MTCAHEWTPIPYASVGPQQVAAHAPNASPLTPEQREFMQERYAGVWVRRHAPNAMMPGMDVPSALARLSLVGMQRGNVSNADAVKIGR